MKSGLFALLLLMPALIATAGPKVIDSAGRQVALEEPARRIVALAPHIVENVYSAGAGHKLVGVVSYSDYPEQAKSIEQVGSAYAWSMEAVVSLKPDLVIIWGSGNGLSTLPQLERLGFNVYVSEPRHLEDISESIRDFGVLAGTTNQANATATNFDSSIERLQRTFADAQSLTVFYQIWNHPLQTINGEHMISAVISLCGGQNIFADTAQLAPQVGLESVLQIDPDVIVASGMDGSRPEWLEEWRKYPLLEAVRHNALLHVHPDLIQRPTARITLGAASLCSQLDEVRTRR